jgi:hypothetical protein
VDYSEEDSDDEQESLSKLSSERDFMPSEDDPVSPALSQN